MFKKLLFVFVLASVFVQCEVPVHEEYDLYGDGIDDEDDDEVLNTTFTCSVGGVAFTGINPVAYKHNQFLSINATNSENKKIQINLDTNTIGVYSLDFDNTTDWVTNNKIYSMMYSPDEEQEFWASNAMEDSEGSVQITHYNTSNMTVSGIFTAYLQDDESLEEIEIVNGVFTDIPLSEYPDDGNDFYCKMDGVEFDEIYAIGQGISLLQMLNISAVQKNHDVINIIVPLDVTPGTYALQEDDAYNSLMFVTPLFDDGFISTSGTVTITSHNTTTKRIKGTFQGTITPMMDAVNPMQLTNGSFEVTYVVY